MMTPQDSHIDLPEDWDLLKVGVFPATDYTEPPVSSTHSYTARYYRRIKSSRNVWWDLGFSRDTPEEVREMMKTLHPQDTKYVIYRIAILEEIVDASAMDYEPGQPYYGIQLES